MDCSNIMKSFRLVSCVYGEYVPKKNRNRLNHNTKCNKYRVAILLNQLKDKITNIDV